MKSKTINKEFVNWLIQAKLTKCFSAATFGYIRLWSYLDFSKIPTHIFDEKQIS
jgi:hypothetical protein